MDDLKKHLQLNREALDDELPGEDVWVGLHERLQKANALSDLARDPVEPFAVRRLPVYLKWSVAAGLVLFTGLCGLLMMPNDQRDAIASTGSALRPPEALAPLAKPGSLKDSIVLHQTEVTVVRDLAHPSLKHRWKTTTMIIKKPSLPPDIEAIRASYTSMVERQLKLVEAKPIYAEDASYFTYFKKQFAELVHEEEQVQQRFRLDGYTDQSLEDLLTVYQRKITLLRKLQSEISRMNDKVTQGSGRKLSKPSFINL